MSTKSSFIPTDDQMNFIVYDVYCLIKEQCRDLQEELGCDDAWIKGMLDIISSDYE